MTKSARSFFKQVAVNEAAGACGPLLLCRDAGDARALRPERARGAVALLAASRSGQGA